MFYDAYKLFHGYLTEQSWWKKVEGAYLTIVIYGMMQIGIHAGLEKRFAVQLSAADYLTSYIFKQTTLIYAGLALTFIMIVRRFGKIPPPAQPAVIDSSTLASLQGFQSSPKPPPPPRHRFAFAAPILFTWIMVAALFFLSAPSRVSHVRIKYLDDVPGLDIYALDYIVTELNKSQDDLFFELDYDVLKRNGLTIAEARQIAAPNLGEFNAAKLVYTDTPLIAITPHRLGEDFFWQCDDRIAVISTFGWENLQPPSVYEYVTYSIIVQSLLLNLDRQAEEKYGRMLTESSIVDGRLAQFSPRRHSLKAEILAAHLSPDLNRRLMNQFGLGYVTTFSSILSLDWLKTPRVAGNLKRSYDVVLPTASP